MTDKVRTCLWFATGAEEAATLYTSLIPDSRIDSVQRSPADNPSCKTGDVLVVEFTLGGRAFQGLNGGTALPPSNSMSLSVLCEDQAEVDRIWYGLLEGGATQACGWLNDRWGHAWQIVPKILPHYLADPDPAKAKRVMEAMMTMIKLDLAALEAAAQGG
jgi:predicted 3-demethylubiquinone-9 3-methyltransferase (glyoxalase superfamily)